jgi:hypothetical protein
LHSGVAGRRYFGRLLVIVLVLARAMLSVP